MLYPLIFKGSFQIAGYARSQGYDLSRPYLANRNRASISEAFPGPHRIVAVWNSPITDYS